MRYRGNHGEGATATLDRGASRHLHQRGDRSARTRVIEQNLPLVHSLARRFWRPSEPLDDLVQAGTIGLIKAVRQVAGRPRARPRRVRRADHRRRAAPARPRARLRVVVAELEEETLAAGARSQAEVSETRELVRAASTCSLRASGGSSRSATTVTGAEQSIAAEVGLSQVQVSRGAVRVAREDARQARGGLTPPCAALCVPPRARTLDGW